MSNQSGTIGHRKQVNGKKVSMPYPQHCRHFSSCFVCELKDCTWEPWNDPEKKVRN